MKEKVLVLKNKIDNKFIKINLSSEFRMNIRYLLSTPFIYGMAIPMIIFHLFIEIYHRITFFLYGIEYVDMKKHFVFNRHSLLQLSLLQKINCIYCEYGNGLASYIKEIIGRTEAYWCPIKNGKNTKYTHKNYKFFMDKNEVKEFEKVRENIRNKII